MVDAFNLERELVRKIQKTCPLNGPKKLFNLKYKEKQISSLVLHFGVFS